MTVSEDRLRLHIKPEWYGPECELAFGRARNLPVVTVLAQRAKRSPDDLTTRAIIEAQPDRPDIGAVRQALEQLRVCSRETIYRLVCIADREQSNATTEA